MKWLKNLCRKFIERMLGKAKKKKEEIEGVILGDGDSTPASNTTSENLPFDLTTAKLISGYKRIEEMAVTIKIGNARKEGPVLKIDILHSSPKERNWKGAVKNSTIGWAAVVTNPKTKQRELVQCGMTDWLLDGSPDHQDFDNMFTSDRGSDTEPDTLYHDDYKFYKGERGVEYWIFISADNFSRSGSPLERSNLIPFKHP